MKVLVTGANGYVGQFLCAALLAAGHELTCLTRTPYHLVGSRNLLSANYSPADLATAVQGQEVVIHLAARAHQPARNETLDDYRRTNLEPSVNLAQAAVKAGVSRFIYMSSIKVNGEVTTDQPFSAHQPPAPQDFYGISKWEAEQALRECLHNTATQLVIIRPPLIWGGIMKGNLALVQQWVRRGIPLPFGLLNNRRDLVSLENLCDLLLLAIYHPNAAGQTLLVSDGIARNTAEIIALITQQDNPPPKIVSCPRWLFSLASNLPVIGRRLRKLSTNLEVDIQPTCTLLGWAPRHNATKTGLRDNKL